MAFGQRMDLDALQRNLKVEIESATAGESPRSTVLLLQDDQLPRALITDERGVLHPRVITYVDLLSTLEESVVIDQLEKEPTHTVALPPLPPGAVLADVIERTSSNSYLITGVLPASEHLITLHALHQTFGEPDSGRQVETHAINLPPVVYRALYDEHSRSVKEFSVALLSPEHEGNPAPDTEIYRYMFSNVYTHFGNVREGVCWNHKEGIEVDLADIPRQLVARFISVPNNPLSYTRDLTHNSPHKGYSELLTAIEEKGSIPHEWLVPAGMTIRELHEQKGREES